MQINRKIAILGAGMALLSGGMGSAAAQGLASPPPDSIRFLTLQEAIEISYRQNPAMEAQRLAREAAVDRRKAAWGLRMPQLGVTGAYTYMSEDIKAFDLNPEKNAALEHIGQLPLPFPVPPEVIQAVQGIDLSLTLQKQQFAVVGATAALPLYTGGKINAAVNAAKINIEKSDQEALKVQTDLFAEVVERYYGLLLAHHVLRVREEVTAGMRKHLSDAEKLEANGMIAPTEKLYAEMYLAQAEGEQTAASLQIGTVNRALGASLGSTADYLPVTALFIVDELRPLSYYRQKVAQNSPILKQVELTRRLAKEGVRAARAAFLPEIAAVGAVNAWDWQLTELAPRWMVGAGVKLRIFDGLSSEYKHAAAKKEVRQVEAMQIKAENDLMTLTEKLYNQLKSSAAEVHALGASVAFAESYLDAKLKAFSEGMAPSSDVVDARLNLAKARVERLAAAYAFDVALAQLLALAGETETLGSYMLQPDFQTIGNQ
ncbi:TolC family protein [uncultured Rikenella sp.]|uniref:TolC family protein n=1 Tax=uncultured Rikenella sp. TaxID=368003 RepID=UPI0026240A42|nr:TolC family protein [uncultured Rikenella sp.]